MSTAVSRRRVGWVDVAKGMAIVLVVLFHSGRMLFQAELVSESWIDANGVFKQLRMPVFFAASGLFVRSLLAKPWAVLWRDRVALLIWVFVLWTALRFAFFHAFPLSSRPSETDPDRLLHAIWAPLNGSWFLHALVVFLVVAKLSSRIPPRVQLAVAGGLSLVASSVALPGLGGYADQLATYYLFFVAASLLSVTVRHQVATMNRRRSLLVVLAFLAGALARTYLGAGWLAFPVSLLAVLAGLRVARHLSGTRPGSVLAWLGRNTLPIYVAHVLVLGAVTELLLRSEVVTVGTWIEVVLPIAVGVVAILVSLGLWRLAALSPLRYLYEAPPLIRGRRSLLIAPPAATIGA